MAYLSDKHELGITNTDGSVIGLMLMQERDTPSYAVFDRKYLADQFFTGTPSQAYQDPERELLLSQYSWRAGMGLKTFDANDPERYYRAKNMDLRTLGIAQSSYKANTISKPQASKVPLIVNQNFELTTGWNYGVNIHRDATEVLQGSYSMLINAAVNAKQYLIGFTPGTTYEFECNAKSAGGSGNINIAISDGVSDRMRAEAVNTTVWSAMTTGSYTTSKNANYCLIEVRCGLGVTPQLWVDQATIKVINTTNSIAYSGIPQKPTVYDSEYYFPLGQFLTKLDADGDELLTVANFTADISSIEAFADSNMYVALNTATPYQYITQNYSFDGAIKSTAAVNTFELFKTVHGASPTLWGNDSDNTLRSTIAPQNGGTAWSTQTIVDSTFYKIKDLEYQGGTLYIRKEDKVYYLDASGNAQDDLTPELESLILEYSGCNMLAWEGKLYVASGAQLVEIDLTNANAKEWISPADSVTDLSEYTGDIQALAGDERWLFAICDNGTLIEVLAGHWETIDGTTQWVWHPLRTITLAGAGAADVGSVVQRRLWILSTDGSDSIYYIPLPKNYGNVANDDNRDFTSGDYFHTPRLHGDFRLTNKAYIQLDCELGHNYDADIYFETHYNTLQNSTWTKIGNFVGNSDSRIATGFLPAAGGVNPVSTMAQLNFCTNTDDNTKTPQLLGYNLKSILYPPRDDIIAARIRCADEFVNKLSQTEEGLYDTIVATMDEVTKQANWPVTIYDIDGDTKTVKFLPLPSGTPRWGLVRAEKGRKKERIYNVLMQEIDTS